jgi:ubiquinone/menaquinone biosynthesis C-methylase UbiE
MTRYDTPPSAPDPISYLDSVAATGAGRTIKRRLLTGLDIQPGQVALDVGCGPGTDLAQLADAVGSAGSVLGIDLEPAMVEEARRRFAHADNVRVLVGDGCALPLPDEAVDRAKVDRVLQHLHDPGRLLAELRRVIRAGGRLGLAEPDWDTLAIDDPDLATSRAFTRHLCGQPTNGTVGRQLARLAIAAGFTVDIVEARSMLFRDVNVAEQVLGLRRNAIRAVRAGWLAEDAARAWLDRLWHGHFLASFTCYVVVAG